MKDALMALSCRAMFLLHGILCFWWCATVMAGVIWVWFLLVPNILLMAEGLYGSGFTAEQKNWNNSKRSNRSGPKKTPGTF